MSLFDILNKLTYYQHHEKFSNVCIDLQVIPYGLRIKKLPSIGLSRQSFIDDWKIILHQSELSLLSKIHEENKYNYNTLLPTFETKLNEYVNLQEIPVNGLQELREKIIKVETTLFNRRITKFIKISEATDIRTIRTKMEISNPISKKIQRRILALSITKNRITTRRTKKDVSRINIVNKEVENISEPQESDANISDLAEVLVSLPEDETQSESDLAEILANLPEDTSQPPEIEPNHNSRMTGKFVSENVFNLSNKNLTPSEIKLLSKGLSFVPTPERIDREQVKRDLERFGRNIKLKLHFMDNPTPAFSETPSFRPPSKWTPIISDTQLEIYLSEIEEKILEINEEGQNYPNLSVEERKALNDLMQDRSIIIKPADKGSAIVIWDRDDYIKECNTQLNDENVYKKIDKVSLKDVNAKIRTILNFMLNKKEIDKKILEYLLVKNPQLGRFYLLPKIHKRTMNVPGRPVISNNGTATERISEYLDFHLKQIVPEIPHILEDTRDFLKRIADLSDIPENAILVSFDVIGLYPHIPHDDGLKFMKMFLDNRKDKTVSTESLIELANIVLKENYFELGDQAYQQMLGTAIGTIFAPTYANLFMAGLEKEIFETSEFKPFLWLRYLDDIFCIWTQGREKLEEFFSFLNEFHPTIKFTMEQSTDTINFLDVKVTKVQNQLETDLYTKNTDTHQYLHASSCHRNTHKKSIPYSQAVRMKRICSNQEQLQNRLSELESWLVKRGYKAEKIRPEIHRVDELDRDQLLLKRPKNPDQLITLVLTYHPSLNKVYEILKQAHRHVLKSPKLSIILPTPPRLAFRNAKNLKDRLVRSKLQSLVRQEPGNYPCKASNCHICYILARDQNFISTNTNETYVMNFRFDCNSMNVIYLLTCKVCHMQYVGSTISKFRKRFNQYKSNFTLYNEGRRDLMQLKFFEHFSENNHNSNYTDLKVQIIDHCDPNNKEVRENFWINKLKTMHPNGLNQKAAQ